MSFVDLQLWHNFGPGFQLGLGKLQPARSAVDVRVTNALIKGSVGHGTIDELQWNVGILIAGIEANGTTGDIVFSNVSVRDTAQPGLEFENKVANGTQVTFRRSTFGPRVGAAPTIRYGGVNAPIMLHEGESICYYTTQLKRTAPAHNTGPLHSHPLTLSSSRPLALTRSHGRRNRRDAIRARDGAGRAAAALPQM